jgi:hypothetical protein
VHEIHGEERLASHVDAQVVRGDQSRMFEAAAQGGLAQTPSQSRDAALPQASRASGGWAQPRQFELE